MIINSLYNKNPEITKLALGRTIFKEYHQCSLVPPLFSTPLPNHFYPSLNNFILWDGFILGQASTI